MPKVTLEDGSELEVLSDEEKTALQEKAEKADTLSKDIESLNTQIKELEEGTDPNWKDIRSKIAEKEKIEKAMSEQGYALDKEGKIIKSEDNTVTKEDVNLTAEQAAKKVIFDNHIASKLLNYDENTRKVIQAKYDLLSAGQKLDSVAGVDSILNDAIKLGAPSTPPVDPSSISGMHSPPPKFDSADDVTPATREMGSQFGLSADDIAKSNKDIRDTLLNNDIK